MRYRLSNGREFVLGYHTLAEWGADRKARLLLLGCSVEYAERVEAEYAAAERI